MAPTAPIEAASVGAAMPPTIEPSTATTSMTGGTTTFQKRTHSWRRETQVALGLGMAASRSGFQHAQHQDVDDVHRRQQQARPTAAANSVPTDSCMMSDSRIRIRLGGMICPSVPEAQMAPQAMPLS
jgi:hypothetical protein